jgi:HEAT repeat protein
VTTENLQIIIATLCTLLAESSDLKIRIRAAEALGILQAQSAVPLLCRIAAQNSETDLCLAVINALIAIGQTTTTTNPMSETPKNQPIFNIGQVGNINTGDVNIQGDQVGIQHNYFGTDPALSAQIADLQQLIADLEIQHPNPGSEEVAVEIVDQALTTIQTQQPDRWQKIRHQATILKQQLFNPERHLQASKATLVEVTKAAWEKSLIVKAVVTYIDEWSKNPNKGS